MLTDVKNQKVQSLLVYITKKYKHEIQANLFVIEYVQAKENITYFSNFEIS